MGVGATVRGSSSSFAASAATPAAFTSGSEKRLVVAGLKSGFAYEDGRIGSFILHEMDGIRVQTTTFFREGIPAFGGRNRAYKENRNTFLKNAKNWPWKPWI